MAVDLHLHSTISDGQHTPEQLVDLAVAAGLGTMALTDHDTFEGIARARAAAAGRIDLIPGCEMSIEWPDGTFHLLGYWVDAGTDLDEALRPIRHGRETRNRAILAALADLGVPVDEDRVSEISGEGVIGRPHIAQALMEAGHVETPDEAFSRFLSRGALAYRQRPRIPLDTTVDLVHRAGGVAVVAHPATVASSAAEYREAFARFADAGIDGVECWYSTYSSELRQDLAILAERHGLVATGGSDHHGEIRKPGIDVGVGKGDLVVPDEVVERLAARRP